MSLKSRMALMLLLIVGSVYCIFLSKQALSQQLILQSPVFSHSEWIPEQYTCKGEDVNPPLTISGIPEGTKSLALIVDDPDAPLGTWIHWVVYNIPVQHAIKEDFVPGDQGDNSFKKLAYGGPCPPKGTHRYFFKLYALDKIITPAERITKKKLIKEMDGHILAKTELMGKFKK